MTDPLEEFLRSDMERETAAIRASDDLWTEAIDRGRRLRRRRRSTWLGIGATAVTLAIAAGALAGRFDADTSTPPRSPITESPSPSPSPESEGRVRVVLDTVELDDGRRVELRAWGPAWGLTSREDGGPCLTITGIDELNRECGRAPSEVVPRSRAAIVGPIATQRNASTPWEVYGATSEEVSRVVVRYSSNGQRQRVQAHLLRGDDPRLLDEAGIAEAFGYFFAELPNDTATRTVRAVAFGSTGERLGSTGFSTYPVDFISGPTRRWGATP